MYSVFHVFLVTGGRKDERLYNVTLRTSELGGCYQVYYKNTYNNLFLYINIKNVTLGHFYE